MQKKYYTLISIFVLLVIVLLQFNNFYKNAYANYIIDSKNSVERNNYNNVIYEYILEAVKLKMPKGTKQVVFVLDEDYRKYSDGLTLELGYTITAMYPYSVTEVKYSDDLTDGMMKYILDRGTDTLIFMGHNMDYLDETLENDINIYKLSKNGDLKFINGFDSDINTLSTIFIQHGREDLSDSLEDITKKLADIYINQEAIMELQGGDNND